MNFSEAKIVIKSFKSVSRNVCPKKSPGSCSSSEVYIGRDGNKWRTHRVEFLDEGGEERWDLVWITAEPV